MNRFTGALVCILAAASTIEASLRIPDSLREVATRETIRNPTLRKKDQERKNELEQSMIENAVTDEGILRRLANQNNGNGYGNGNNNYNNQGNNYNAYNNYGNNAYANADAYNNMEWDDSMEEQGIGFDITNYAVKYTQCATVQTFSDNLAESDYTDTVLAAQRFALFRLCPKDQCSSYSHNGCGKNYGEYLVSLDQFLLSMLEYQESRVAGYCNYCQQCAATESAKNFWKNVYSTRNSALETAQESYQTWYTSYLENYYANGNYQNGQAYQQANDGNDAYGNNNNNNGYQQVDANLAAQRYYQQVRNSNNYANNYAQNNYNYGGNYNNNGYQNGYNNGYQYGGYQNGQYNMANQWQNPDNWQFQNSQQRQYNNQNSWASMGSPSGSFYGKTILNGYYDGNGEFEQVFGYFNNNGEYVSLEDEEISWDESLWGEMPDGWDGVTVETESCSYKYAGSCYNQYESCMQILEDQEYQQYKEYQNGGNYQGQANDRQNRATLKDFLGCVEIDPYDMYGGGNFQYANQQNAYNAANQQQNQENYEYKCYQNGNACDQMNDYNQQNYNYQMQQNQQRRYFVGPHCGSNNRDISLAVYKDAFCSVLDENSSVKSLLGYQPYQENTGIDLVPDECLSCLQEGQQEWYEDEEVYSLEPMCSMLYQFAGKCNKNLDAEEFNYAAQANNYNQNNNGNNYNYNKNQNNYNYYQQNNNKNQNGEEEEGSQDQNNAAQNYYANLYNSYDWKQMYQSKQQQYNEEAVCAFIESLASNTYDENGEVVAVGGGWSAANLNQAVQSQARAMSPGIKAALTLTAIAAASMAIAACVLHGALARKNIPWKPRRSKGEDPTDLARQNSGITMGRSRSGPGGNNPLL